MNTPSKKKMHPLLQGESYFNQFAVGVSVMYTSSSLWELGQPMCEHSVTQTLHPSELISSGNKLWIRTCCTVKKFEEFPCFLNICFIHKETYKHLNPLHPFPPHLAVPASVYLASFFPVWWCYQGFDCLFGSCVSHTPPPPPLSHHQHIHIHCEQGGGSGKEPLKPWFWR